MNHPVKDPHLRRFWFPVPGHLGIGVSAHTRAQAEALAGDVAQRYDWDLNPAACIEDIDIRSHDAGHVLPNMGPVVFAGVWYPQQNL